MKHALLVTLLITSLAFAGCTQTPPAKPDGSATDAPGTDAVKLLGSGSTFVAPAMDKWRIEHAKSQPGLQISYTGGGSGKGKTDVAKGLVDFAGTDSVMKDAELANATGRLLHIPVVAGGVAVAYHVPGLPSGLRLDGATVASIFLGTITRWNDPALVALNPDAPLPDAEILVVHRSDGSGTTATFTDYLDKADARWRKSNGGPGSGSSVNWPAGTGANGNNGVGNQIQQIPYSIGYLGSEWGNISKVQTAHLQNRAGAFVASTPAGVSAALGAALASGAFDEQLRGSATHMEGAQAYPIAAVTWVLVAQEQPSLDKGRALVAFLDYALGEGQQTAASLQYAPLPASLVAKAQAQLDTMTAQGQKLR